MDGNSRRYSGIPPVKPLEAFWLTVATIVGFLLVVGAIVGIVVFLATCGAPDSATLPL
jgi:hypothetical protein